MPHPQRQHLKVIGSPIKMSRTPIEYKRAPPMLGQHTDEILSRILSKSSLDELKSKGIVE